MPINAHPGYLAAEKEYLQAQTPKEKIIKLKKMISLAPSHKGAENLRKQLKTRLKKLLDKQTKTKKSKSGLPGIKKEDMQAVIIGFSNSGKSSLIKELTNAKPLVSPIKFSTTSPVIGIMNYQGVNIQLIENPAIESEYYNKGLTNTADTLIILITEIKEIQEIQEKIKKTNAKKIIVLNQFKEEDKRKISATLSSKKYNYVIISIKTKQGIQELKEKIFQSFDKIRVYTKEPGKEPSKKPIILNLDSDVKDVAEKILKGFSEKIKETKIWGPSSKFPGQKVGLKHKLKDKDIIEFKTK
ncbi:hypothetical protein DRN73_02440 [Candidatus Pacearchaeota archaeon]|nr:MAG: hypothetical protein DRN73_02440 [Candidatus Pacearchaeota archaeon]